MIIFENLNPQFGQSNRVWLTASSCQKTSVVAYRRGTSHQHRSSLYRSPSWIARQKLKMTTAMAALRLSQTIPWNKQNQLFFLNKGHFCRSRIGFFNRKKFSSEPQILMENIYTTSVEENDSPRITKLTLNRPKANAMGRQLISEFQDCINQLEKGTPISGPRCVIVTSSSPKVFSAGADLKERASMTEDETEVFVALLRSTMQRFAMLPMPTIAAIDGVAVGGGLELALAADLRVASPKANLGLPETTLAIIPGAGGTQRLPRLIGIAKAKELVWTGTRLSGKEALDIGLVDRLAPVGSSATDTAVDLAKQIASSGPVAVWASKEAIEKGSETPNLKEALKIERASYAKVIPTKDRLEGLQAFRENRKPSYTGE